MGAMRQTAAMGVCLAQTNSNTECGVSQFLFGMLNEIS
jgi:hypothetical protein